MSEDPVGWNAERLGQPTRGHAFGYAAGNPLSFTDPEGLDVGQPESTTKRAQQEAAQVEAFMKFSAGVDPRSPEFRSLAYNFSGLTSPDGNGFARFDKDALDALCTRADRAACELLAQNELNQLGAGVALAATPGVAARLIKPASKLIPLLMKAWLAVSVATMYHDAPGGAPVKDPVTYATQQVVTNAASCWGGQGETPERARACIGHATDAATLGLASLETKPGTAAVDLLSRLEFGYTEEQLSRFYSFPGPLPVRLKPPPLRAGDAGAFGKLDARAVVGDELTPHHMPQAAAKFTSREEGGALALPHGEHVMTRTYGARGRAVARQEAGMAFRDVLARDVRDIRQLFGPKYNEGLMELLEYYRTVHPDLMCRVPRR